MKFYNSDLDHWHPIATSSRKLTTTTTWQLRVHELLLSWIHSNHKYSHLCFSLSSLCSNWSDHQALDINLDLDNPKYVWRQTPLDLTRDSYTQYKQQPQNVTRVFLFILKAKHKTLHVIRSWDKLENSAKKTFCMRFDRLSLIFDRSSLVESE